MVFINVIASVKTLLNFGCIDGCRSLNRSRFLKFEKNFDLRAQIQKPWNRRGVGVWKCDSSRFW